MPQRPAEPKLWKALFAAALFVFPASLIARAALFHAVPEAFWWPLTAVLWFAFGFMMDRRIREDGGVAAPRIGIDKK